MANNDTICRTCLRLWQGLCDGEKEQTVCKWYKQMTNDWLKQEVSDGSPKDCSHAPDVRNR